MACDTSMSLLTLAEVKQFIEGSTTGTSTYDAQYNSLIDAVSQFANTYTGRQLKYNTFTSDYDGNGTTEIYVKVWPFNTTSVDVFINSVRSFSTGTTTYKVPSTDILLYTDVGKIILDGYYFEEGRQNVRIIYTGGYSTSTIPYELRRACLELCQFYWNREMKKDRIGIRNESAEGGSRTYETDMPWSVKKILDNYREGRY
jgi:hypothetical protein